MTTLISEVKYPEEAELGESVEIEVFGTGGVPLENRDDVLVRINGIIGARQFLQFATAAEHKVVITAAERDGNSVLRRESKIITIAVDGTSGVSTRREVADSTTQPRFPLLRAAGRINQPYQVGFVLEELYAPQPTDSRRDAARREGNETATETSTRHPPAADSLPPAGGADVRYEWSFGDGTVRTTSTPYMQHDFSDSLDPDREQKTFHVSVTVTPNNRPSFEVKRSLSVLNAYALCKRFGAIVPPVYHEVAARPVLGGIEAVVVVKNVEAFPLVLNARRIQVLLPDHELGSLQPLEPLGEPVEVPANQATFVSMTLSDEQIPEGAVGITVHLFGEASSNKAAVRVEAAFDLPSRISPSGTSGLATLSLFPEQLARTAAAGEGITSRAIGETALPSARVIDTCPANKLQYVLCERLERLAGSPEHASPPGLTPSARSSRSERSQQGPCLDGEECDPTAADPISDCRCLFTTDQRKVTVPGRFVNARKGNIVLLAGGVDSLVGNMLRRVKPAQFYNHCVMITKDPLEVPVAGADGYAVGAQEITHNAVCFERLLDPGFWIGELFKRPFPIQGLREDIVKYIWPGVITQTTHGAVTGEAYKDPETGKSYTFTSITVQEKAIERQGGWEITPPLVIKPDPFLETQEIRDCLHKLADDIRAQKGKWHYRLYAYSDADITDTPAPQSAKWAAETSGSMCSSFLWALARKHQAALEKELDEDDIQAGVEVKPGAPDGLYHYDEAERLEAAQYVADYVKQQVVAEADKVVAGASILFSEVKEAARNVANQIVNTFVSDKAGKEGFSDAWKKPGVGSTVSPDDLLRWDAPMFGYCAPALYRKSYDVTLPIYRWSQIKGTGSLTGVVRYQGNLVEGATVTIPGIPITYTDREGTYRFPSLSVGTHQLFAAKTINGVLRVSHGYGHVVTRENLQNIELKTSWRKLMIEGQIRWRPAGEKMGPEGKVLPLKYDIELGGVTPFAEHTAELSSSKGDHVRLTVTAAWNPVQSIRVELLYTLKREGVAHTDKRTFQILPGQSETISQWGVGTGELFLDATLRNGDFTT